jgi:hypothetical protein
MKSFNLISGSTIKVIAIFATAIKYILYFYMAHLDNFSNNRATKNVISFAKNVDYFYTRLYIKYIGGILVLSPRM